MYLELKNLNKSFGSHKVVKDLSLTLEKGKILCLLGPSGCGKTTTLKMIGGFLVPDSGKVIVEGEEITNLSPEDRPVSTVFQSYALFPHMTVLENVIYGLKYKGMNRKAAKEKGMAYLATVDMADYAHAYISEISGGQQQRVALVRSLIVSPKVLLLDEPLSNLDARLRLRMREELRGLQEKYNSTMVFVTHDQEEAMVLGDEIAIMHEGRLMQKGNAEDIYRYPENDFVRSFLGLVSRFHSREGREVIVRPEEIIFSNHEGLSEGRIVKKEFLGFYRQYEVELVSGEHITVRTSRRQTQIWRKSFC